MNQITMPMMRKIISRQFSETQLANSPETRLWIEVLVLAIAERHSDPLFFEDGRCQTIAAMIGLDYPVIEMILSKMDEIREKNRKVWAAA